MRAEASYKRRAIRHAEYEGHEVRYVDGQLVVRLKSQFSGNQEAEQKVISALPSGSTLQRNFDRLGIALINLPESTDVFRVAREIEDQEMVAYAEPNFVSTGS